MRLDSADRFSRRAWLAGALGAPLALGAAESGSGVFDSYFLEVLEGFLRNARRTSGSYAVCDFEGGTILKGSVGRSGKTYDSVTRMLPALAAWVASGRERQTPELPGILAQMFRHAFDPAHPDYWLPPPPDHSNQRQVESSIVAWSLWLLADSLLPQLTSAERANIQAWLASCTQVPVRNNNWAWFTAVNHAVRIRLSERWKEFSGDPRWMLEDLKALDGLAAPGDGWYSDSPREPVYDYYNFWVFASHFLYWNRVIGARYPEWSERFAGRLKLLMGQAPYFFGANGAHVLYGRSLIYRFAVLTPLVLAYQQGLWPHPPGLLRRLVRRSLEYHWGLGAYDRERGKLRETYSAEGTREICDSYIDNGHPYWGMQAFAVFLIPPRDRFWHAAEEPLPVERADFDVRCDALRMRVTGTQRSGEVRWLQSLAARGGPESRDGYTKLVYSSHFPFNVLKAKDRAAWDSTLVFRNPETGACATRAGVSRGELTGRGLLTEWWAVLEGKRIDVTTRLTLDGEFVRREHTVRAPAGGIEAVEGSPALGLGADEEHEERRGENWYSIRSAATGHRVVTWNLKGYETAEVARWFEETWRRKVNAIYPRMAVNTLRAKLSEGATELASLHYASPRPLPEAEILRRGAG